MTRQPLILHGDAAFMADPFPSYATWRRRAPIHRAVTPNGSAAWLVTRYLDVRRCLVDPRLSLDKTNSRSGYRGLPLPPALDANLLNMDPPQHSRVRRLVSTAFTPRRLRRLEPSIRRHTVDLLAAADTDGRIDIVGEFAFPLSLHVIATVLGVPQGALGAFQGWAEALFVPHSTDRFTVGQAVNQIDALVRALVNDARSRHATSLLGTLVTARDHGDRLSEDELTSLAFLLLLAGHETTAHLIGNAVLALLERPHHLASLRARPGLLPVAVEEFLRFTGPNPYAIRRFALDDVQIGVVRVPAGDTVLLGLASAHRDPDAFEDPDTLRFDRTDNTHLAFGHGAHYCLGAALARTTIRTAIGALIDRYPRIELESAPGALQWRPSFRSRGLVRLPILVERH
ncbi:cytochrome P450 family protein [Phytohabitans kaempferiae]|uniref:Cytochrome P450 n=1 Tax=Phytohabitans kaempferiae TaxID=1620943 RepID=A0ABV6MA73_9ACTN